MSSGELPHLELWGGIECTVNRVGDQYFDQLARSGHGERLTDLDAIADLGIRVLRYPLLWERITPNGSFDWDWADARLARLRGRGVEPIAGLLHHGSGPRATSLLDPGFPEAFARYAMAVARRYPWIRRWTPINEPLTTARFSALYGHWYPHARDDRLFARAVVNQLRASALAMSAIRLVIPDAELVQTEDIGRSHGTPLLQYQADFENERRWLTFDILSGRLDRDHAMWAYLIWAGISERELEWFREVPCGPDMLGINYYVTSERWLDERLERYPAHTQGGNGRHEYADVEAARALPDGVVGAGGAIADAWRRYGKPIAITEAYLSGHREQQLRWLREVWEHANTARAAAMDVRAVTAWSLLGAFDWHTLVTREEGNYDPGAFDVRSPELRPTALATMVRELATAGEHENPVTSTEGWWRHDARLLHPVPGIPRVSLTSTAPVLPLLITGAAGTLGRALAHVCADRQLATYLATRRDLDIGDPEAIESVIDRVKPWAVVNAAGYVRVDDAEDDCVACERANLTGAASIADVCARRGIPLVTFSSDLVFDGDRSTPYFEGVSTCPLCVYGRSKAEAERRVLERMPDALVIRTSAFFGPWDAHNFVTIALRTLCAGDPVLAAHDQVVSPTYVPDLAHTLLDLLIDREQGVWHLANVGAVSWVDLAREAAERAGLDTSLVLAIAGADLGQRARRPAYSVLGSERGVLLPSLESALDRYFESSRDARVPLTTIS